MREKQEQADAPPGAAREGARKEVVLKPARPWIKPEKPIGADRQVYIKKEQGPPPAAEDAQPSKRKLKMAQFVARQKAKKEASRGGQ